MINLKCKNLEIGAAAARRGEGGWSTEEQQQWSRKLN
jgi:hypothetical protein